MISADSSNLSNHLYSLSRLECACQACNRSQHTVIKSLRRKVFQTQSCKNTTQACRSSRNHAEDMKAEHHQSGMNQRFLSMHAAIGSKQLVLPIIQRFSSEIRLFQM